jgi:hypothetical protein
MKEPEPGVWLSIISSCKSLRSIRQNPDLDGTAATDMGTPAATWGTTYFYAFYRENQVLIGDPLP